jgi:hypothetical protein
MGVIDVDGWTKSIEFMKTLGLVPQPVTTEDIVREDVLPAAE